MGLFDPIGAELFDLNGDGTLNCVELGNYYDVTNEIADSVYGDDDSTDDLYDIDEDVDEDVDEDLDDDLDDHHDDGLDDYFGGDDF